MDQLDLERLINAPDSPRDIPATVKPLTSRDRQAQKMRDILSGQPRKAPRQAETDVYIWREADKFTEEWLPQEGYDVWESAVFDDCVGYRCGRNGHAYTVFMYAFGKRRTALLDGDYCARLRSLPFAARSTVLVVYLRVERRLAGERVECRVGHYSGNDSIAPELWRLAVINGKPILQYYPGEIILERVEQLMYAFNRESVDAYECIMMEEEAVLKAKEGRFSMRYEGTGVYDRLLRFHREYEDMKLGYVRCNDVVYSAVPYIDGLGYFTITVDGGTDKIKEVTVHPFDGGEHKVEEFIRTEQRENAGLFGDIPKLVGAEPLPPNDVERFALLAFFANGECGKYVLPVEERKARRVVASYLHHVFTDKIWASAAVIFRHPSKYDGYPECGPAIVFKNEFYIAGTRCYMESEPYSEPELTNEVVYEDQALRVKKIWSWNANSAYQDEETGFLRVLISGQAFNRDGKSTLVSVDGRRLTSLTFDDLGAFHDGLAKIERKNAGYGYITSDMKIAIPMEYTWAEDFENGMAQAKKGDTWCFLRADGRELIIRSPHAARPYQDVGTFHDGLCRVSTLRLTFMDLAFHSDHDFCAGTWGFVDEMGQEVITPQYIYALDFNDGIALVAKGKWTIDPKWDQYKQGRYWTDEELWGGIDTAGREVIPCVFDEIGYFENETGIYRAHYGGWENGKWGIIDRTGKWLVEPAFEEIDYEFSDGLFAFRAGNYDGDLDEQPWGIFDAKSGKALFPPQFLDVSFNDEETICVAVFDKFLGRTVEKLLDRSGRERFKSIYTGIYTWKEPYEVYIRDKDGARHGLIGKDGSIVLPCVYDAAWNGIDAGQRRIIFIQDGKQGVMDFDGNVIIPPVYCEVINRRAPLLTVRVGNEKRRAEGLLTHEGKEVLPARYERISWCNDKRHFFCCGDGRCEMYQVETTRPAP